MCAWRWATEPEQEMIPSAKIVLAWLRAVPRLDEEAELDHLITRTISPHRRFGMEGKTLAEKLAESAKGGCGRACRRHSCDHCRVQGIRARNACRAAPAATKASLIVGGSRVIRKVIGKIAIRLAAIP